MTEDFDRDIKVPSRREHIEHCKDLYGYGFEKIHKWMDGTVKSRGPSHRVDRHDIDKTPDKAYDIFKDKVPEQYRKYIKDAVKDHIELDNRKGEVSSKKDDERIGEKSLRQAMCGGLKMAFVTLIGIVPLAYFFISALVDVSVGLYIFLIVGIPASFFFSFLLKWNEEKKSLESGEFERDKEEPKNRKSSLHECPNCGRTVPDWEWDEGEEMCDTCVAEDTHVAMGL
ncbi:hypothetical protein AKJ51_00020 [candidate division MSBL1 archaeon SCGC-AAA382A20]|uniref:Uncharacterized protein n=1 Tax=candidate division MSBL1 archaeon SCGC-AAA382A20 TaxID=1698280 RepID=A0A133VMQ2_9EURY|nr:hypothetical protein AKJ51_00020 [candidate division MSBL1 archaeon SCGC-AAA382A20]